MKTENLSTYDRLQILFLEMHYSITEEHLLEKIQEFDLKYVITGDPESKRHIITIAFDEDNAAAGLMDAKSDCLAVSYLKVMGGRILEDVSYIKNGNVDKVAIYRYHYDEENEQYGYTYLYYDANGDFRGILLKGQNSNLFPCENAKEAIDKVIHGT